MGTSSFVDQYQREIRLLETKEGTKTLSLNNILVHSRYYPSKEATAFIDGCKNLYLGKKHVVVYGLGLGYHIKELLTRLDPDSTVYVFDLDHIVVEIAAKLGIIKDLLRDNRLRLYTGLNHLMV